MDKETNILVKTLFGLENVLENELKALGFKEIRKGSRAVSFKGGLKEIYQANYLCRSAMRVLKPIIHFTFKTVDEYYENINAFPWEKLLHLQDTFSIDPVVHRSELFTNSIFASHKAKDGIVDRFYKKYDERPSVNKHNPDLYINIHVNGNKCTVSIDSSGESLHKRGYRAEVMQAPINEVLAAGMLLLTGWKGDSNLVNPMCGSATLAIEAAMIANNIPAGQYRKHFAFMSWRDFDPGIWRIVKEEAREQRKEFDGFIFASDISDRAIQASEANIKAAKMEDEIFLEKANFHTYEPAPGPAMLILNPPYGERLKVEDNVENYKKIGDTFKQKYKDYKAWLISSDLTAIKNIGLKTTQKITLYNGSLECRFVEYDIFEGSKKDLNKEDL